MVETPVSGMPTNSCRLPACRVSRHRNSIYMTPDLRKPPPRPLPGERDTVAGAPRRRGFSSAGRAPALQAGGQRFESVILHY